MVKNIKIRETFQLVVTAIYQRNLFGAQKIFSEIYQNRRVKKVKYFHAVFDIYFFHTKFTSKFFFTESFRRNVSR